MKKKIILTETQYIKLTDSLLEDINRDLKYLKNGDILTFELMNGNKVNLKIASVNINNNEILGYGPNNEKIMLRIGEFNNEKGVLKFYQYNDDTKKYIAQKISIKDMNIFRDNELFVPDDEVPTYNHNNNPSSKNVGDSDYFKNLKVGDTINILDINDETTSIEVDYIGNDEIYGNDSDNNNLVVKYIDEENNKIFLLNDKGEQKTIKYKSITISDKDSENVDDNEDGENIEGSLENYDELFHKYYDEVVNDPNLRKAFYTAPSFWNYFTSALKNKKARGSGIFPAYELINNYFSKKINDKLPGFTNKENKRASFYLFETLVIPYEDLSGKEHELVMTPKYYKATVRQYEAGMGDVKILTYKGNGSWGFKVAVKKPTGDRPDEYYCDIYVNINKVEENRYVKRNVILKFINSDGYTSNEKLNKDK